MEDDFKKMLDGRKNSLDKSIPLAVIDMQAYGMMNGGKVLDQALSLIREWLNKWTDKVGIRI